MTCSSEGYGGEEGSGGGGGGAKDGATPSSLTCSLYFPV